MNIKKYLQQRAEEEAESLLTENDRQFCRQLAEQVQLQPVLTKRKMFNLKTITSLAAVLVVAIVLGVTLPLVLNKNAVDEIYYKEENIVQIDCTVDNINNNTQYFQVSEVNNVSLNSQLKYDSISGDNLYYLIDCKSDIALFTLYIVVNEKYDFNFKIGNDLIVKDNINYEVFKGVNTANYMGYINVNTETVYINYTQLFDVGEQAFFDDIQSVLKVKN